MLSTRRNNANHQAKHAFDQFTKQMIIQDANCPSDQTARYSPINYDNHRRGVYLNASSDMINRRGEGTTYYHELAHMIDHAATGFNGNLSNTQEFRQALLSDGQRILNAYNNATDEGRHSFVDSLRRNDRTHSFQDLLDATINGAVNVGWSHSRSYWQQPGNLQAEAFAHFFEASMGAKDKLERLAFYFPKAFSSPSSAPVDEEYYAIEDDFAKRFGHKVPREMLPDSISMNQIKKTMKSCLASNKDCLMEILGIPNDETFLY